MNPVEAQRVIESLRCGIPPDGHLREFTVGRGVEIRNISERLRGEDAGALLVKANYGVGKTHLLRLVRESGLAENHAVSLVTLDASSAVRFSRLDEIISQVMRQLEIPGVPHARGIRALFDLVCQHIEGAKAIRGLGSFWEVLTNHWQWDFSEALESPALFAALRAWSTGNADLQNLVEDWLYQPWNYYTQRLLLYQELVSKLRKYFRDPRPEHSFTDGRAGIFNFQMQNYAQSWGVLRDLLTLVRECGYRSLILLFDEFEDVITNVKGIKEQQAAFWHLFQFFAGKQFPAMSFYAVTPDFISSCKTVLLTKGLWDYDYSRFEALSAFEVSPLGQSEIVELSRRIVRAHGVAYGWDPEHAVSQEQLLMISQTVAGGQMADRARHAIRELIRHLDRHFENIELRGENN